MAKERAISKKQREGNVKFKSKGGVRSSEVKLDPKKHRNVSRRQVCFLPPSASWEVENSLQPIGGITLDIPSAERSLVMWFMNSY